MQAREATVVISVKVQGECDNRFRAVRDALGEVFVARGEVGIAVAAYVDGKPVWTCGRATPMRPGAGPGNAIRWSWSTPPPRG